MNVRKLSLLSLIVLSLFFLLTGCYSKKVLTAEDYKNRMKEMGYSVADITPQYGSDSINTVYFAVDKKATYQIEFYEMSDNSSAKDFYEEKLVEIEAEKSTSVEYSSTKGLNNSKCTLSSENEYFVVSRVENTVVFVHTIAKNREEVDKVLLDLNY